MNNYITSIATANPQYRIRQQDILDFMVKAHQLDQEQARQLNVLYRATGIQSRYSVIEDYQDSSVRNFYPNTEDLEPFPTTKDRVQLFQKEAIELCAEAGKKALGETPASEITHLITVSCTGMYAPGIDIELIDRLGLNTHIERTGINFMGCYAAFNAIKVADAICSSQDNATVLIVCVELCSIHFQKENVDDFLLANALFGDGAAALLMSSLPKQGINLKTKAFYNDLYRKGNDDMAWKIGDFGFEMRLSAYVPDIIKSGIKMLLKKLTDKSESSDITYYAVHPGGKRILQVIEEELNITKSDNQSAHDVLGEYGNMSSPTILFVLKKILDQLKDDDQDRNILGLAFGPGLTLESLLLTIEKH